MDSLFYRGYGEQESLSRCYGVTLGVSCPHSTLFSTLDAEPKKGY